MNIKEFLFGDLSNPFVKGKAMSEEAPVVDNPVQAPPADPTLGQALAAKLDAVKAKFEATKAKAEADVKAVEDEVKVLEVEFAAIPEHLKALFYKDVVAKVEGWFK